MNLNQALHGLERGHSYRLESWPEGTYIKKGENDTLHYYTNDNLNDKEWVPTYELAYSPDWVAVDAISAPGPTPAAKVAGLFRKLEGLPLGTVLTHYNQIEAVDLAFFDTGTQKLTFQYRDERGNVMASEPTITLMQMAEWVNEHAPAAELTPPTTDEPEMNITNQEEIIKLCSPLQERLRANDNFVRIEIPIADAGFQVEGEDASLLISINREDIRLFVHVDGKELENAEFSINQRLVAGPISQREAKPLSAIAVPNFMIAGQLGASAGDEQQLPNTNNITDAVEGDQQTLRSTFEPEVTITGLPDLSVQLGTYRLLGGDSRYFEANECKGGLVYGGFVPTGENDLAVISVSLFEMLFRRLPKVTKGVRLQLAHVGTQIIVSEVGDESAIVDVDLGFATTTAEIPLSELQDDKWVFVSFNNEYGLPKETPAESNEQQQPAVSGQAVHTDMTHKPATA